MQNSIHCHLLVSLCFPPGQQRWRSVISQSSFLCSMAVSLNPEEPCYPIPGTGTERTSVRIPTTEEERISPNASSLDLNQFFQGILSLTTSRLCAVLLGLLLTATPTATGLWTRPWSSARMQVCAQHSGSLRPRRQRGGVGHGQVTLGSSGNPFSALTKCSCLGWNKSKKFNKTVRDSQFSQSILSNQPNYTSFKRNPPHKEI